MTYYCPECGTKMKKDGYILSCPKCYFDCDVSEYNNDDDVPEGCAACGGPYPDCTSSCSLFDD